MSRQLSTRVDHHEAAPSSSTGVTSGEPVVVHHFVDVGQQREAAELGMWLFLVTEIMFFGAFCLGYLVYRYWYPAAFALGSQHMDVTMGTINTAVLLTSSYTMALAVNAAERGKRAHLVTLLLATSSLGTIFLGIKGFEYYRKYVDHLVPFAGWGFSPSGPDPAGLLAFFNIYFLLTGLHALHLIIGVMLLLALTAMAARNRLPASRSIVIHNASLYWHFVDLVWVYLFPLFYLVTNCASSP